VAIDKSNQAKEDKRKSYSRRDFVVGSGTAIVGGTLTVYRPGKARAEQKDAAAAGAYPLSTA